MKKNNIVPSVTELKQAFKVVRSQQIPSVPDILVDLNEELDNEEPDTALVSDLVSMDPAITGQVIKLVNSPQLGLEQRVQSIKQAIVLLGLDQVRNLVTAAVFQKSIQAKSPAAIRIWNDSLKEAQVAMNIACEIQDISQDEAYLAALLHNCGALLLAEKYSIYEQLLELETEYPVRLINQEIKHIGTSHAVTGFLFAMHWKLSERICQAIYLHHTLKHDAVEDPELRALIATIKLAHLLVRERYLSDGSFSVERIQYFSYAKEELLLDSDFLDELRMDVIPKLEMSLSGYSG